jgi:hypothetical protein
MPAVGSGVFTYRAPVCFPANQPIWGIFMQPEALPVNLPEYPKIISEQKFGNHFSTIRA